MVGASSRHCNHRRRRRRRRRRPHEAAATSNSRAVGEEGAAARPSRRSTAAVFLLTLAGVLVPCSLVPGAEAMAKNDGQDDMDSRSPLGLLAQACASSHCGVGVDGLDLWLSLEERCDIESTPSLTPTLWASGGGIGGIGGGGGGGEEWSVAYTAVICACVWSVLVYAGFRSGLWVGKITKGRYPVV